MQAIVAKADLQRITAMTERACNTKSSLPILQFLKLSTDGETLTATGTDLELTLEATCEVTQGAEGTVCVIAEMLTDVVKGLPNGVVELKWEGAGPLTVRSGRSRYKVPTLATDQMPTLPERGEGVRFACEEGQLKAAINRVLPALGTDDTRPALCGMLWRPEHGRLQLVGTDAHRLHVASVPVADVTGETEVIVPARACRELERLLSDEEAVALSINGESGTLFAEGAWGSLAARLSGSRYPQWQKILPTGDTIAVTFDKAELAAAIKRAAVVAAGCGDRIELQFSADSVNIHCECEELGEALEVLPTLRDTGTGGKTAFSARQLYSAVVCCPEEVITLHTNEHGRQIKIAGDNEGSYFSVVMPMRLLGD